MPTSAAPRRCATRSSPFWPDRRRYDVYRVPRRNYLMGRRIRGSGWYPNFRQPQLFRKGSMRYTLEPVHEGYEASSAKPVGTLRNAIWQFPFRNLEEVIRKMNRYSSLGASKLAHKRVSMASAFGHAVWAFLKHYVFKRGFIDGWAGFVIAFGYFEVTFYRYAKRYESDAALGAAAERTGTARTIGLISRAACRGSDMLRRPVRARRASIRSMTATGETSPCRHARARSG